MAAPGPGPARRSPWRTLGVGVALALCTIAGIGAYTYSEVRRLRDQQTAISERNRKDSLQLLRIQNDLASLSVLMRDMADGTEPYPLHGWQPALERVRRDLDEATRLEESLAPADRDPAQQARLRHSLDAFWRGVAAMFAVSKSDENEARRLIRSSLITQHRAVEALVSQFLVTNNRVQEEATRANRDIYDRVGREILLLVGVVLAVTTIVGVWVVMSNRRAFLEVADLNGQLRTLSRRMLRVQEDVQRSLARELHDDFGQIVTAIGTLLGRARRQLTTSQSVADELDHVRTIAQQALDRIRSRSQWLHPGVLDDFGLERALEVCVEQFQRQTGVRTHLSTSGALHDVRDECAIHVYRVAQEALNNAARHSGSAEAWVRLTCGGNQLVLEVEDHGCGLADAAAPRDGEPGGLGLVSMRERAELIGGTLQVGPVPGGGTRVQLLVNDCLTAAVRRPEVA